MYMVMYMSLDKKPKLFQSTTDVKSYWRGPGNQTNKNPKPVGVNNYEKKFRNATNMRQEAEIAKTH